MGNHKTRKTLRVLDNISNYIKNSDTVLAGNQAKFSYYELRNRNCMIWGVCLEGWVLFRPPAFKEYRIHQEIYENTNRSTGVTEGLSCHTQKILFFLH